MIEKPDPTTFASTLLTAVAPWNDRNGFWEAYNAALATMGEEVHGLVSDQGDPTETVIAATTVDLAAGVPVTVLNTTPLGVPLDVGDSVSVIALPGTAIPGTISQTWIVTKDAQAGDQLVHVDGRPPNGLWPWDSISLPAGSQVQSGYLPGWSVLLDPYGCPDKFLAFLAQFVGVPISPSTDPDVARSLMLSRHAHDRGTPYSIVSAAQANLSGTKSAVLLERTNPNGNDDAYYFLLVVNPAEVVSVTALTDAVESVKPAGILWKLIQISTWIIAQMEARFSTGSLTTLEAAFTSIANLEIGPVPFATVVSESIASSDSVRIRYPFSPALVDGTTTSESISIRYPFSPILADGATTSESITVVRS